MGIFSGELIFGGAYYWREFWGFKIGWTSQYNSLKHEDDSLKQLTLSMGLYSGGLIIGRIFASEIWGAYVREGLFFGGAYYRNFTVR